jgi:hypothetical protein
VGNFKVNVDSRQLGKKGGGEYIRTYDCVAVGVYPEIQYGAKFKTIDTTELESFAFDKSLRISNCEVQSVSRSVGHRQIESIEHA